MPRRQGCALGHPSRFASIFRGSNAVDSLPAHLAILPASRSQCGASDHACLQIGEGERRRTHRHQRHRRPLCALAQRPRDWTWTEAPKQSLCIDRVDPSPKSRPPAWVLEARSPGAYASPCLPRVTTDAKQKKREPDRGRAVMTGAHHPKRHDREDRPAPAASVSTHVDDQHHRDALFAVRSADLTSAQTVPYDAQRTAFGAPCRTAHRTRRRPDSID